MKMENYKETNETEIIEGYSDKTEKESVIETGSESEKGSDEKGDTSHTKLIDTSHTELIDTSERRMHHKDNHEKEVLESEKKDNKSKEMDSNKKPVDMENKMHEQIDNEAYNRLRHMKECIKEIRNYMVDIKEEELTDCPCKLEVPLDSLTDIFKHYGILCYCMVYHKKTVPFNFNTYIKAFLLEVNLIEYLYEKPVTIPEVYFGKQEETNARDKYVASYKTFFNEVRIHINCEQDIESLSYKYYKHYSKVSKDCSYYLDPLLFLLFKRRESERFFLVFGNYTKTIAGLRFALLLSLFNECCKESDEVLKICVRNRMAKDEGIFYDIKKQAGKTGVCNEEKEESSDDAVSYSSNSSLSKISDVKCMKRLLNEGGVFSKFASNFDAKITNTEDARKDCISKYFKIDPESSLLLTRITSYIYDLIDIEKEFNTWFSERQLKKTWENSVKKWAFSKNKDNGNSDMDNSMILQCSKYKKFEEGYLIFSMQSRKNERCMLKTCFLCLHAYRNTNEKIWIERICDLLRSAAVGKMKSACCAMTDNILEGVLDFTEEGREMLLLNVISIFERYHLEKQEDLIDVILRGFFTLTTHCKDSKTCDLCYNYTLTIYKKWKESKQGFFFKKNSKFSDDIYSSTLGVCDQSNHCDTFHRICRDILNSNDSVGNNVICRLENYHKKCNCQKMVYSMHQNDKSYCEVLLKHCMCGFKE